MSSETTTHEGHAGDEHHSHALPIWLLVGVWVALMGLTVLTVVTARMDLGALDFPVAMLIATMKATLVALVFMHLLWDKGLHSVLVVAGVLFLALFLGTTLFDRAHYQASIEDHERDHPFPRRFEIIQGSDDPHHGDHGDEGHDSTNDGDHSGDGDNHSEGDGTDKDGDH